MFYLKNKKTNSKKLFLMMKEAKESKPEIPELVSQKYVNVRKISQKRISEEYGNPAGCLHGVRKDTLNLKPGTKFFIGETKKKGQGHWISSAYKWRRSYDACHHLSLQKWK